MAARRVGATGRALRLLGLLLAALVPLVAVPASAQEEPAEALSEREAALTRLDELNLQLAAGAEELGQIGAELRDLELEESQARAVLDSATRRAEAAAQRIVEAETRVGEIDAILAERNEALADRAVDLYVRGAVRQADLLGGLGLGGSEGVTDRLPYLEALALSDAALVEDTEALGAVARAAKERLQELRDDAREQQSLAREATLSVAGLRTQQQQIVAAAEAEEEHRADLILALEQDAAARQALIERLQAQAAFVSAELATQPGSLDGGWIGRLPPAGQPWGQSIIRAAGAAGIDPRLLAAVAWTESNFRPRVVSPAGAVGLAQLLPSTAASVGVDPWDPDDNLRGGARYLAQLYDRYLGRAELAIAAYNAGPGNVDDAGGIPDITETQIYVTRVLGHYETLTR